MSVKRKEIGSCGEPKGSNSIRAIKRNFLNDLEIQLIRNVTERGMKEIKDSAGPTIMDPDMLLVLGPGAKLKRVPQNTFSKEQLKDYQELMKRIQNEVIKTHNLETIYHTAPTFIARLTPLNGGKTSHVHDECKWKRISATDLALT